MQHRYMQLKPVPAKDGINYDGANNLITPLPEGYWWSGQLRANAKLEITNYYKET